MNNTITDETTDSVVAGIKARNERIIKNGQYLYVTLVSLIILVTALLCTYILVNDNTHKITKLTDTISALHPSDKH